MRALVVGTPALCLFVVFVGIVVHHRRTQAQQKPGAAPVIPKTWDDAVMATLEVPLANPSRSPKHVPSSYYYKIPVQPIYRSYPVYAPGHEPPGYIDWLKKQEPEILWDDKDHAPPLKTDADWIKAGEIVFDAPTIFGPPISLAILRQEQLYERTKMPVAANGTVPFLSYVVTEKGQVQVGGFACAMCHTRVMPDGSILEGAQGNFPFDRWFYYGVREGGTPVEQVRTGERALFGAPWTSEDWTASLDHRSLDDITSLHDAIPPGVIARHGSSPLYPVQVPDLIGVRDRHYLDRTGLQQHCSLADMMRYAALNQGGDFLSSFDGFIPAGAPDFKKLPDPISGNGGRYSDAQLYALALYVYSLTPPPNPNKFDALAARGKRVFAREGCAMCHTPPLYTNNKLTPAEGFTPPPGATQKYAVLPISVGTDPGLALKTRRGTGYYKVPSLKGVWYRSMFGHSGWCATLEDWFDPRRARDDYVPTGFKPFGTKTYAVKGHPFGLDLSEEERTALVAFLKTL
jgi:hypothetical protein